ncbi:hypothetical protein ACFY64_31535 [Streptomyces collinus]|uniref:hypothetical protein n=1 Tax=Streptomyces collinus TaxID=42684 RepID=UPI0036754EC1
MATEPSGALAPLIVEQALNQALNGNPQGGGLLLAPLITASRAECFALCVMLATAANYGVKAKPEDGMFVLEVEDTVTGRPARPEDLPADLRFAARFAVAWGNEDRDMATTLFDDLADQADTDDGLTRLIDGVIALYAMAIATTRALVDAERANPNQEEN